ncbi:Pentatricopeptide repeat-containing protein [Zea mays]|uniref:Pentatricopeptide repeat-containing protein n=1 Tax=Zea mays TaxID=4577 RepID=A0A3L6FHV3_MAIZE|nr:Pentatricopeptide repeat-containing protein [Zea mays]
MRQRQTGRVADALSLLVDMLLCGCQPNVVRYIVLQEAMCKNSGFEQAMAVLDEMLAKGCTPNIVMYNVITNDVFREGCVDDAREILNRLSSYGYGYGFQPNTVSYTTLLKGLCASKRWDDILEFFVEMMEKNCMPNEVTFDMLIRFFCRVGMFLNE